jgi:DNA polymerase III subunit gamma/tau
MDNFIVSARKYRPTTFEMVVGQSSITVTLKNAIKVKQLAHAYLFCGPRGVGKTTCARIFAKTINCSNLTEDFEACNECESCKSFNTNRSYNIHELDAASNNSVDDIRNLIEQVRIPPQVGTYSVYIIDEVHMLSSQAFNAFLKTLEEPPAHAIFILATTEKHKIIPTILSRCQIFDFNRIKVEDTMNHLSYVAEKESVEYELEGLNVIAQKSDGAMRDALSIFDQIVSFAGKKVTYDSVIENLNVLDYEYYFRLTEAFVINNVSDVLLIYNEILDKGFDGHNFIVGMAKHFRDLLVCKDKITIELLEVGAKIKEMYLAQSVKVPQSWLFKALEITNKTDISYKSSTNQRLHIELALVQLASIGSSEKKNSDLELIGPNDQKATYKVEEKIQTSTVKEPEVKPEPEKEQEVEKEEVKAIPNPILSGNSQVKKTLSIKDALAGKQESNTEVVEEKSEEVKIDKKEFTQENLDLSWMEFAERFKGEKPRIFNMFDSHKPLKISDSLIELKLANNSQDEDIKHIKVELMYYLRSSFDNQTIEIQTKIEEIKENGKKLYTDKDKYEHMLEKNPNLKKLKDTFNLDFM